MSGEAFGVQRIHAEEVGGAGDGQKYEGFMLQGAPHAVLVVDSRGRPFVQAPSGLITDATQLLDLLEQAITALRKVAAGEEGS